MILESAIFHGPTIRNTARRLALRSEASMRHEKGIGHDLPRYAVDRAARLMAEITGARVAQGIVDNDPEPRPPRVVEVELPARRAPAGHLRSTSDEVGELLAPLGFAVAGGDAPLTVTVPEHRLDVVAAEDVAEEIARATATIGSRAACRRPRCRRSGQIRASRGIGSGASWPAWAWTRC